jgi:hypothetical protein
MYGFTANYVKVAVPFQEEFVNTLQQVTLDKISKRGIMEGQVISQPSPVN